MAHEKLQAIIQDNGGLIISDGTLNTQHLLTKAYDFIGALGLDEGLREEIRGVFVGDEPTFYNQFYGKTRLNESKIEEAEYIWNEDVFDCLNGIAPEGYYFGSSEGDGACIGFFKWEEA